MLKYLRWLAPSTARIEFETKFFDNINRIEDRLTNIEEYLTGITGDLDDLYDVLVEEYPRVFKRSQLGGGKPKKAKKTKKKRKQKKHTKKLKYRKKSTKSPRKTEKKRK